VNKALTHSPSKEHTLRQKLHLAIEKKQTILEDLMEKGETLKVELDFIKHEYNVRIGGLLLKDNHLDLEILQLKNLKELIKGGMSYKQALKFEEDAFYTEMLEMQKEQERLNEEKKILEEIQDVSEEIMEDIKTIWKKLIRRFHPDLVVDPHEKQEREEIMKKINKAYTEHNLDVLYAFESSNSAVDTKELTIQDLEKMLETIENAILNAQGELNVLKKSTWYEWKKKKDKVNEMFKKKDIFAELEQTLLDDIVKKIEIVQRLREEVHPR